MSTALRNFEAGDLENLRALICAQAGPELSASPHLEAEALKTSLFVDQAFGLIAEDQGKAVGTLSVLMEQETPETVLGLLSRFAVPNSSESSTVANNLVQTALQSLQGNLQLCFAEVPSTDLWAQAACEQAGFIACGFLPQKFRGEIRPGCVTYLYLSELARNLRRPHPKIIPGARELATEVLQTVGMIDDTETREDIVAYPTEGSLTVAPIDGDAVQTMLQSQTQLDRETFAFLQGLQTKLHLPISSVSYIAAKDGERVVGILGYVLDPFDKRVQITEVMALEGEPEGMMIASLLEMLGGDSAPEYWEVLVSAHAPRLQKTFDQVGFVPCAYFPAFGMEHGLRSDAIKMIKLNVGYEADTNALTSAGKSIFTIMDTIFREHSVGAAVLKLLRDLRVFRGMGEGELRRVARLFSQKLFRPSEVIFEADTEGRELYVVERGEIEIQKKGGNEVLGTIKSGAVLGEIAFLNGEPRTARAISKMATIVRVIHRDDFDKLIQREIHLGLIFFQNVALDLAEKLKNAAKPK